MVKNGNFGSSEIHIYTKGERLYMTLEEFCQKYNYAESSVLHGFPRVKESILKTYGVEIIKIGRGKKAEYIEKEKSKELQIEELHEFLEKNPQSKEYVEGLNK